jgi:hypothetical protein
VRVGVRIKCENKQCLNETYTIVLWIKEIYDCTQKNMNYEITSDTDLKKFKELDQREILDRYIFNFEQKTWYIYIYTKI